MSNASKLAEILSRSKAVMQKTDENHGSTIKNTQGGNSFSSEEKEIPNLTEDYISRHSKGSTRSVAPQNGQYRNLKTSKMHQIVFSFLNYKVGGLRVGQGS